MSDVKVGPTQVNTGGFVGEVSTVQQTTSSSSPVEVLSKVFNSSVPIKHLGLNGDTAQKELTWCRVMPEGMKILTGASDANRLQETIMPLTKEQIDTLTKISRSLVQPVCKEGFPFKGQNIPQDKTAIIDETTDIVTTDQFTGCGFFIFELGSKTMVGHFNQIGQDGDVKNYTNLAKSVLAHIKEQNEIEKPLSQTLQAICTALQFDPNSFDETTEPPENLVQALVEIIGKKDGQVIKNQFSDPRLSTSYPHDFLMKSTTHSLTIQGNVSENITPANTTTTAMLVREGGHWYCHTKEFVYDATQGSPDKMGVKQVPRYAGREPVHGKQAMHPLKLLGALAEKLNPLPEGTYVLRV